MNWLQRRVRPEQIRELSLLAIIVVAVVFFGSLIDNYYSFRTFNRIASSVAIITVVAVGQTLVVLTRNIDLSVGSIVGFTAYFVGTLIANHPSINPLLAIGLCIVLGAGLGVVNGLLVAFGRVPAVVVTLGTLAPRPSPPTACRNGCSTCRSPTSFRSVRSTSAPCSRWLCASSWCSIWPSVI